MTSLDTSNDDIWRAQISTLQDQSRSAYLEKDVARLSGLWSAELQVNSPNGRVLGRVVVLDLLHKGVIAHLSYEEQVETLSRHGDTVVAMGHDTVVNAPDGPRIERRFTNVWRAHGETWTLIARHANAMPKN